MDGKPGFSWSLSVSEKVILALIALATLIIQHFLK